MTQVFCEELKLLRTDMFFPILCHLDDCFAPYFWDAPASSSGKYHPASSLGAGGLVRHTKSVVAWFEELWNALPLEESKDGDAAHDTGLLACILHDAQKFGTGTLAEKPENSTAVHAPMTGRFLHVKAERLLILDMALRECFHRAAYCVAGHMGKWTDGDAAKIYADECDGTFVEVDGVLTLIAGQVALADYCSSRKMADPIYEVE